MRRPSPARAASPSRSAADLPLLPEALDLALRFQPGGLQANRRQFEPQVEYRGDPGPALRALLFDPQTSGGLLLLVPPEVRSALLAELPEARGDRPGAAAGPGGDLPRS